MSEPNEIVKLSDLTPDSHNANKGTVRGRHLLETSLSKYGAGRSIVVDKNGRIIAGNKTAETAGEIGLDDVVIVRTDGKQLVAVMREDLDLNDDDTAARMLAYADNRVGAVSLDFDPEVLLADVTAGLDLGDLWLDWELEAFIAEGATDDEWGDAFGGLPTEDRAPFQQMTFTLHDTQVEIIKEAARTAKAMGAFDTPNENSNGNALARICETFMTDHGQS